jgi:hypothetical protein
MTTEARASHERTLLPFRVLSGATGGHPVVTLEYDGRGPGGVRRTYRRVVGPPEGDDRVYRDPLGVAVLNLMQLYRELEGRHDQALKERDEARGRARQAEEEAKRARRSEAAREGRAKREGASPP